MVNVDDEYEIKSCFSLKDSASCAHYCGSTNSVLTGCNVDVQPLSNRSSFFEETLDIPDIDCDEDLKICHSIPTFAYELMDFKKKKTRHDSFVQNLNYLPIQDSDVNCSENLTVPLTLLSSSDVSLSPSGTSGLSSYSDRGHNEVRDKSFSNSTETNDSESYKSNSALISEFQNYETKLHKENDKNENRTHNFKKV